MPIWLTIIGLFVLGFILILIEVIIIPGFGLGGILGAIAICAACYTAFSSLSPLAGGLLSLISIIVVIALVKLLPKTSVWKKTRLSLTEDKQKGYQNAPEEFKELVNKTGVSLTILRPSGTAIIDDQRYDVVADCEFIEKNKKIIVTEIEGTRIVVKEIKPVD
ncbi:MAG: NfeD family protein [Candidatus Omnitrophota bacterium]